MPTPFKFNIGDVVMNGGAPGLYFQVIDIVSKDLGQHAYVFKTFDDETFEMEKEKAEDWYRLCTRHERNDFYKQVDAYEDPEEDDPDFDKEGFPTYINDQR
ncbi:hypothetical protein D3C87_1691950 [compost metagenome]